MQHRLWLVVVAVLCVSCGEDKNVSGADGSANDETTDVFTVPDTAQPSDTPAMPADWARNCRREKAEGMMDPRSIIRQPAGEVVGILEF